MNSDFVSTVACLARGSNRQRPTQPVPPRYSCTIARIIPPPGGSMKVFLALLSVFARSPRTMPFSVLDDVLSVIEMAYLLSKLSFTLTR